MTVAEYGIVLTIKNEKNIRAHTTYLQHPQLAVASIIVQYQCSRWIKNKVLRVKVMLISILV